MDDFPTTQRFADGSLPPAPPERFAGRFRRDRLLGRGGLGEVWKAWDELLEDWVAIKFLHPHLQSDDAARGTLRREVLGLRRLSHPSILKVYDLHESEGLLGIAMELIDGRSLASLLWAKPQGVFDPEELLPLLQPLADALDHAHREGVLHRDIKPANILIGSNGIPKLADFGLARRMRESFVRTSGFTAVAGTLPYLSPQALMGDDPTPSDDLYAFAATIFECVAGQPPFHTGAIDLQIREKRPPSVASARRRHAPESSPLPAHWDRVLALALDKSPSSRPSSARELLASLAIPTARRPAMIQSPGALLRRAAPLAIAAALVVAGMTLMPREEPLVAGPSAGTIPSPAATPAEATPGLPPPIPEGAPVAPVASRTTPTGLGGTAARDLVAHLPLDGTLDNWPGIPARLSLGNVQPIDDRGGQFPGAVHFSGSTCFIIDDPFGTGGGPLPADYSIAFWFRAASGIQSLFALEPDNTNGARLTISVEAERLHVDHSRATDSRAASIEGRIRADTWHHLAVVVGGGTLLAYVDGNLVGRVPLVATESDPARYTMHLGGLFTASTWSGLVGAMDDVRWYRRALTPVAVRSMAIEDALPRFGTSEPAKELPREFPYAVTRQEYPDAADWAAIARAEFGEGAVPADWREVKAFVTGMPSTWMDRVGLSAGMTAHVLRDGEASFAPLRFYNLSRIDGRARDTALVHDSVNGFQAYLGSTSGQRYRLLVRLPAGITPSWAADLGARLPADWTWSDSPAMTVVDGAREIARDQRIEFTRGFTMRPAATNLKVNGVIMPPDDGWDCAFTVTLAPPEDARADKTVILSIRRIAGSPGDLEIAVAGSLEPPRVMRFGREAVRFEMLVTDGRARVSVRPEVLTFQFVANTWTVPALRLDDIRRLRIEASNDNPTPLRLSGLRAEAW